MRKFCLLVLLMSLMGFSQDIKDSNAIEVSFFRGNVIPHTTDLYHLQGHPDGVLMSLIKQTHGKDEWQSAFNFPDYGVYLEYQNYNNDFLGKVYGLGALYNFYFLNRNLELKVSQGIGYATNPYDKVTNSKNKAFGSTLMANTNIGLYYKKENIIDKFGFQTGLLFTHFSNGRTKTPNSGVNTLLFNLGLNYDFSKTNKRDIDTTIVKKNYRETIKYNFGARSEVVEGVVVGEGSVLAMGVYLGASTKIVDRATGEIHIGKVPPYSVVVSGNLPGKALPGENWGPSTYCAVIVKKVDAQTRSKTAINELLRD